MKKKETSATFGVIGLGRFGSALVECLSKAEKEVIAVDRDESRVREARRFTDFAMAYKTATLLWCVSVNRWISASLLQ